MRRLNHSGIGLSLIMILAINVVNKPARAKCDGGEKPIRLSVTPSLGPIGKVESFTGVKIDGRLAYGDRMIWGGELFQVEENASARVTVDSVGQVLLTQGAIATISVKTNSDDDNKTATLTITLKAGDIRVTLQQRAAAYIETCHLTYKAAEKSSFRFRVRDGIAQVDPLSGEVTVEGARFQYEYFIDPVKVSEQTGVVVSLSGPQIIKVKPGKTEPVNARVKGQPSTNRRKTGADLDNLSSDFGQLDAVRRITTASHQLGIVGAGVPVHFVLDQPIGEPRDITILTDARGIATYNFIAGDKEGSATLTATVLQRHPDDIVHSFTWKIEVVKPFWTTRKILSVAALATIGGLIVSRKYRKKRPIEQIPPIDVTP